MTSLNCLPGSATEVQGSRSSRTKKNSQSRLLLLRNGGLDLTCVFQLAVGSQSGALLRCPRGRHAAAEGPEHGLGGAQRQWLVGNIGRFEHGRRRGRWRKRALCGHFEQITGFRVRDCVAQVPALVATWALCNAIHPSKSSEYTSTTTTTL